jgi:phage terminase large subunit
MTKTDAPIQFPAKLRGLFKPARYKVARGGRGSGKSWGFARALLAMGASRPLRVLCAREVQESIKQSVHRLLKDQIEAMGLGGHYEVLETEIRGKNGSLFVFAGLLQHTVTSIKSYEGFDVCWVEEAQNVSARSWNILIPTIRKEGSEIWVTFNPELDTDETYVRFVENTPPDCLSIEMNWRDNPWFNGVLNAERLHAKGTMTKEDYDNTWEGKCRSAVVGAIYSQEVGEMYADGRVCLLPHDAKLKTHVILDLGWNDSLFVILAQRHLSSVRVIETLETDHKTYSWLSTELRTRRFNWGTLFLPHDGAHGNAQTGLSARQQFRDMGWKTAMVPNVPVETGIRLARQVATRVYLDKEKACGNKPRPSDGVVIGSLGECLKRYRRHVNSKTDEAGTPVHDRWSHGADGYRYLSLVADKMDNDTDRVVIPAGRIAVHEIDGELGM